MTKEQITISEDGEKELQKLEKERHARIERLEKDYQDQRKKIIGEADSEKHRSRLKFWGKSKIQPPEDPKYWALVNIEALKEFVKYGANKVMDQIRIRTHANIIGREEIMRAKEDKKGVDAKTVLYTIMMVAVVGSIAFVMITQFFNYRTVSDENIELSKKVGSVSGQLAACQAELATYKPGAPAPPQPKSGEKDNVLEG